MATSASPTSPLSLYAISVACKALAPCILGEGRFRISDDRLVRQLWHSWQSLDRYIVHCVVAHPALDVKISIIVCVHVGKTGVPIRYRIL